jgi:hypothetical protein
LNVISGTSTSNLIRTQVGDRYVLEQMLAQNCNVGGEASGHIILSDYNTTGDGFVAALQLLSVVRKLDRPVSEVCRRFEPLPQILKNVRYASGKPLDNPSVQSVIAAQEGRLNGHGRLLIRASGTEPVIRVMGEGDDRELVEDAVDIDRLRALARRLQPRDEADAIRSGFAPTRTGAALVRRILPSAIRFVLPSRTMTDAIFLAFQAASGDNHPVHYDVEYCRRHGMPRMLAHGFQVLIQDGGE